MGLGPSAANDGPRGGPAVRAGPPSEPLPHSIQGGQAGCGLERGFSPREEELRKER